MLPPSLRDEVLTNTYGNTVKKFRIFEKMNNSDFIWHLLPTLKKMKLEKEDILYW